MRDHRCSAEDEKMLVAIKKEYGGVDFSLNNSTGERNASELDLACCPGAVVVGTLRQAMSLHTWHLGLVIIELGNSRITTHLCAYGLERNRTTR